jgi:hypothetical protein
MARKEEYFIQRTSEEAVEKRNRYDQAESLFGSDVHVELDGTVLYPRWMKVESGTVSPEDFESLSEKGQPDSVLMREGLVSKHVRELQIMEVKKDGGSVEAAIRAMDKILVRRRKREQEQVDVILQRTRFLIDYFSEHELTSISEEDRESLQQETIAMLESVGLEPDRVRLDVKKMMVLWLIKASKGEDTLSRVNKLITEKALFAAQKRAKEREMVVGGDITTKYSQMKGALVFARASDRKALIEVGDEIDNRFLRNVYLLDPKKRAAGDIEYTRDMAGYLAWLLEQTKVKPYRPIAVKLAGNLRQVEELLWPEEKARIHELRLVDQLKVDVGAIYTTLHDKKHVDVYSEGYAEGGYFDDFLGMVGRK